MQSHEWDLGCPLPVADGRAEPLQQHREDEAGGEKELIAGAHQQRRRDQPPQKSPLVAEEDEADDGDGAAGCENAARDHWCDAFQGGLTRTLRCECVEDAVAERHVERNQCVLVRIQAPAEGEDALADRGDDDGGDDLARVSLSTLRKGDEERCGGGAEGQLREEAGGVSEKKEGQVDRDRAQKPKVAPFQVRAIVLHGHRLSIGEVVFREVV